MKLDLVFLLLLWMSVERSVGDSSDTTATSIKNIEENIKQIVENHSLLVGKVDSLRRHVENLPMTILSVISAGYMQLDNGWYTPFNGFQYKFTPNAQTWNEISNICRSWGGQLAVYGINDAGIRRRIINFIPVSYNQLWIGLRSQYGTNWQWVTGEGVLTSDVTIWKPGAARRVDPACAYLNVEVEELTAVDSDCENRIHGLCEKEI